AVNQALATQPAVADRLAHPTGAVDTDALLAAQGSALVAKLAYRDSACSHLRITGTCPTEPGQLLVSERSARAHGIATGQAVALHLGSRTAGRDHAFQV